MDFSGPRSMVLQIEIGSACTCWNVRAGRPKSQRSKKSSVGDPFGLEFVLYGFGWSREWVSPGPVRWFYKQKTVVHARVGTFEPVSRNPNGQKRARSGIHFAVEVLLYGIVDCGLMSEMGVSGPRSMVLQIKSGNACLRWNIRNGWSKSQR